jgi:hypothetical protein
MPVVNDQGGGAHTVGSPTVIWISISIFAFSATNGTYNFGPNSLWFGPVMAATSVPDASMTFSSSQPVTAVGRVYQLRPRRHNPTISVHDSTHTSIESDALNFLTGGVTKSGFSSDSLNRRQYRLLFCRVGTLTKPNYRGARPRTLNMGDDDPGLLASSLIGGRTARRCEWPNL